MLLQCVCAGCGPGDGGDGQSVAEPRAGGAEAGIATAGDEDPGVLLVRSVRHGTIFRVFRGDRGYPESIAGGQFSTLAELLKSADL